MLDPHVTVTVEASATGITVLGEVRAPGVYPPPGKPFLSDLLATAGGLTANSGRVIEISNDKAPDQKTEVPWDPTMHNTSSYDRPVHPGDRVVVRACGIAYVGGHVGRPGAYSLCGSQQLTLSEVIALAGGVTALTSEKHTYLIRTQVDGTRVVEEIDLHKVLRARAADPVVKEDDIVFVTPSTVKDVLNRAETFAVSISSTLFYSYHP
jgi:polysaccharide export outer membrane protein